MNTTEQLDQQRASDPHEFCEKEQDALNEWRATITKTIQSILGQPGAIEMEARKSIIKSMNLADRKLQNYWKRKRKSQKLV